MSDSRLTRRTALGLLGLGGATVLSGVAAGESREDEDPFTHENGTPVVRMRSESTIPFEQIADARQAFVNRHGELLDAAVDSPAFALPETNREDIVAYNLVLDGAPREYFGYYHERSDRSGRSRRIEHVHDRADDHIDRQTGGASGVGAMGDVDTTTTGDFDDWVTIDDVEEDHVSSTGNLYLNATCHRKHSDSEENDAYGFVSFAEMGGGGLTAPDDTIRNVGLEVEHDWASNADMSNGDRYPKSKLIGTHGESWEVGVNISWPPGITASGGGYYEQADVQTLDESDPWANYGKWVVEIESDHTQEFTAHLDPVSAADVDRTDCVNPPHSPPIQPVGHVIATGEWVDIDPNDPDTYQETHSIGFNDGGSTC
ncbi:hypothetical protein [Halorubrum tibetense]|uniref:Uncharacterized protein n=1 Tax=Halorubrum tibetense TaxID=175631 RepID=A0ABD5SE24_9EURY